MNAFSLVCQVFGSVEAVNQIEEETGSEKGEVQHSILVKDIPNDTTDSPQLRSCNSSSTDFINQHPENTPLSLSETAAEFVTPQQLAQVSEELSEKITSGSQSGGMIAMDPARNDKVSATEKMATVSESELLKDTGNGNSKETSAAEGKSAVEENDQTTHDLSKVSKAADTSMNLKSTPENTNVLKLETEIHNEYFQAPPLGQTLTLQAHKSKGLEGEALCPPTTNTTNVPTEKQPEIIEKPEIISEKAPHQMIKTCVPDPERKDAEALLCNLAETKKDKAAEIPFEKPGSNSPVRQVLNALQSASRGSLSLSSRQSPDTADSDDSPSALEMEDIPAGITCVTSEDIKPRPLAGLAAPPISLARREKMASEDLVLDHHLDTACNTSPEGTDLGLSEEEPEMENVLTEPESAEVGGDTKHDESSEEQTYSVSIKHDKQTYLLFSS